MNRILNAVIRQHRECTLPAKVKSMCETGCIYRDPGFKHLRCPKVSKFSPCAAPCPPEVCDCFKTNPRRAKNTDPCLQ